TVHTFKLEFGFGKRQVKNINKQSEIAKRD
ncbi:hypothetical protein LINPERHAP1_LOCUS20449, partial [Linum perenne]